jgi:hypothetical protein
MVLNEVKVRGRGQEPWQHGDILRHDVTQHSIQNDMVRVRPKLNGCFEKGCLPRGFKDNY